ncbi:hypothetical protein PoB_007388200 [Plakobranchus ocellatus]|uniref:Uncharacterized protein n=1 Tax=Plakobranchus ocellatus TaxID=259542 RepID=A0AAV4DTM8_9GAST|nr:hypothetical protein PoB_007388200 [Plakobranchus ocellatus]
MEGETAFVQPSVHDEKANKREANRLSQQRRREPLKSEKKTNECSISTVMTPKQTPKLKTREQARIDAEKREKARLWQQKRRAKMHPQKEESYENQFPVVTCADGNCVPRSLSVLIFGTLDNHVEMRCRIVLELALNSLDYLCLSQKELNFLWEHSDCVSPHVQTTFELETLDVSKPGTWVCGS